MNDRCTVPTLYTQSKRDLGLITVQYRGKALRASVIQLANTFFPLVALYYIGILATSARSLLVVPVALLAAGLIVRAFNLQHDCAHGSFFKSKRANEYVGIAIGILTLTPHICWRRFHLGHHAGTGNLDKRGVGDVKTLTVGEYLALPPLKRLIYRAYRHPLVLFGFGAFFFFLVTQRLTYFVPKDWRRERVNVWVTNLGIVIGLLAVLAFSTTPLAALAFHAAVMFLATGVGVWLFYVQHQFPRAYWVKSHEWKFTDAALVGASFYDLNPALHWFSANIGYHHIHHLDVNIPNYRLKECHDTQPQIEAAARFTLSKSFRYANLKLWDEVTKRMVSFDEVPGRVS